MVIGSVVNSILFEYLRGSGKEAGLLIRDLNEENPGWFQELVRSRIANSGWWVMPPPFSAQRFGRLKGLSLERFFGECPLP